MAKKLLSAFVALTMLTPTFALAEEAPDPDYVVLPMEAGDIVPFDGVLLSLDAAAKVLNEKRFSDVECEVRVEYELKIQEQNYQLRLDYKDIEINSWKDKYESMMILKTAENDRLMELVTKQKPSQGPLWVALGFGVGTLTSLGIFALSTEIVKQ